MAILNDSTGTLMSCAHKNHDCKIGIIVGKTFLRNQKKKSLTFYWLSYSFIINRLYILLLLVWNTITRIT